MAATIFSNRPFRVSRRHAGWREAPRYAGPSIMSSAANSFEARRIGRRSWLMVVASAVLGLVCVATVWRLGVDTSPAATRRTGLLSLVRALGAQRAVEARLTGGFSRGAASRTASFVTGGRRASVSVLTAVGHIEARYLAHDDPESEADWATASLVLGDTDGGVTLLRSAIARAPERAEFWSDMSAALVTAASGLRQPELWIQALQSADRALALQPRLNEARFNRALALDGLFLTDQARAAWDAYLSVDRASDWADEALERRTRLEAASASDEAWRAFRGRFESRSPTPTHADAAPFRARLRLWIEHELLPAWGRSIRAGRAREAAQQLGLAEDAARVLRDAGGDSLPAAGVARIRALEHGDAAIVRNLAEAHLAFPEAARLSDDGAYDEAARRFNASVGFREANSPYASWSALYESVSAHMVRDLARARTLLSPLEHALPGSYLMGLREWIRGLLDVNENRLAEARAYYLTAWHAFDALGEEDAVARMSALLAESYRCWATLGRRGATSAWRSSVRRPSTCRDAAISSSSWAGVWLFAIELPGRRWRSSARFRSGK
jgi:tetratricopeptide (TPR) repeat protein